MKKIKTFVKWFAGFTCVILAALGGLYVYYFHVFTPAAPVLKGKYLESRLQIRDHSRSFGYYVPAGKREYPAVVFVLHGSRGTGEEIRKQTGFEFDLLAEKEGFIAVYPNGYEKHWNDCRASASFSANRQKIDDNAFFAAMIDFFVRRYAAEPRRVYVMGFSNGGHMAFGLAYEMPEKIAAIAVVGANLPVTSNLDCKRRGKPVSVAILNGTVDPLNPYGGGLVAVLGDKSRGSVVPSEQTAAYWLRLAAISGPGKTIAHPEMDGNPQTSVSQVRWQSKNGIQVRLYTMHGSGHVIASPNVRFGRFYGNNAGDIDAPAEIWNFFSEVPARKAAKM